MDSSKPQPPPTLTRLSASALIETIDGPVEIIRLAGKSAPVLTRLPGGRLGFRLMSQVREVDPDAALMQLTNSDGQRVEVGEDHVFLRPDGSQVRAKELKPGARLDVSWTYPPGYELPEAPEYAAAARGAAWGGGVLIQIVERSGRGPVYGASVNQTKTYFLTFGAHCRAQV